MYTENVAFMLWPGIIGINFHIYCLCICTWLACVLDEKVVAVYWDSYKCNFFLLFFVFLFLFPDVLITRGNYIFLDENMQ